MSKKRKFGISDDLGRGFTETISIVENNVTKFRNVILPLSRIELDPHNPRKLHFDLEDARTGIKTSDKDYIIKNEELKSLLELAETIKNSGIINPIVAYKINDKYRIVAGERRCLASLLAGKTEIDARVFNDKPKGFSLKLVQWIENTAREDLSLSERIGNIVEIYEEYKKENPEVILTTGLLQEMTGLSSAQSSYYFSVINAPEDVKKVIAEGKIQSLDKAAVIVKINENELRKQAIQACYDGISLKQLRALVKNQTQVFKLKNLNSMKGRVATKVHFGVSSKIPVAKMIIQAVLADKRFRHYENFLNEFDFSTFTGASNAFKKLVSLLEKAV